MREIYLFYINDYIQLTFNFVESWVFMLNANSKKQWYLRCGTFIGKTVLEQKVFHRLFVAIFGFNILSDCWKKCSKHFWQN